MKEKIFTFIITAMSYGSVATVISTNVPDILNWLAWLYILLMIGIGLIAVNAERIITWCNKKLGTNDEDEV